MKTSTIKRFVSVAVAALLLTTGLESCHRRELSYTDVAEIDVIADWSRSGLSARESNYGATVVFFPTDGGQPTVVLMGDRNGKTVRLPEGTYDVLLFNRTFEDFDNIGFRGHDRYHTLEAHLREDVRGADSRVVTEGPDELAADRREGFTVSQSMLGNYTRSRLARVGADTRADENRYELLMSPTTLTYTLEVIVNIKGLSNIHKAECSLTGMPESVYMHSGRPSDKTVEHRFDLASPRYEDGSTANGSLSSTITVFGFDETIASAHLRALLTDGKTIFEDDLDHTKIRRVNRDDGSVRIIVEFDCPTTVPTVSGPSSGFDADVNDWSGEENHEIDI